MLPFYLDYQDQEFYRSNNQSKKRNLIVEIVILIMSKLSELNVVSLLKAVQNSREGLLSVCPSRYPPHHMMRPGQNTTMLYK